MCVSIDLYVYVDKYIHTLGEDRIHTNYPLYRLPRYALVATKVFKFPFTLMEDTKLLINKSSNSVFVFKKKINTNYNLLYTTENIKQ